MKAIVFTSVETFAGPLFIAESDKGVCRVGFAEGPAWIDEEGWSYQPNRASDATQQLAEYFAGTRRDFDLELDVNGTAFQRRVWNALVEIPYGQTTSYGALAKALGQPGASRAVGSANGKNALAVVIPCHRVIAASGSLAGFAWGTKVKRALLDWESQVKTSPKEIDEVETLD